MDTNFRPLALFRYGKVKGKMVKGIWLRHKTGRAPSFVFGSSPLRRHTSNGARDPVHGRLAQAHARSSNRPAGHGRDHQRRQEHVGSVFFSPHPPYVLMFVTGQVSICVFKVGWLPLTYKASAILRSAPSLHFRNTLTVNSEVSSGCASRMWSPKGVLSAFFASRACSLNLLLIQRFVSPM